jgi:hypothetical protein
MRPQSIIMFERLFLGSLAISAIITAIGYGDLEGMFSEDPALAQLGLGMGFLIGVIAVSFAIYLLLWYLIAHKASNVAKWILVVLVVLGLVFSVPALLMTQFDLMTVLNFAAYALEIAAVTYLFRADATAWLGGQQPADPTAFD